MYEQEDNAIAEVLDRAGHDQCSRNGLPDIALFQRRQRRMVYFDTSDLHGIPADHDRHCQRARGLFVIRVLVQQLGQNEASTF
jgi:hypothetical protein